MCVELPWQQRHEDLMRTIEATGALPQDLGHIAAQSAWLPDPPQSPDGQMHWREDWWYPPPDLLARLNEGAPIEPQGMLLVELETSGRQLCIILPLVPRAAWIDPRQNWKGRMMPFLAQH